MTGKFIVIEGLEGAGKSSAIAIIKETLAAAGIDFITTREPGGTPMAEAIRECVKQDWQEPIAQSTELLLMYAARSQLVNNIIKPELARGIWVIADRHDWSSIAYQGGGREIDLADLTALKQITMGEFEPDFTIYLDIDPKIGLARAASRGALDRIELAGEAFFARCREMYLQLVRTNASKSVLINAEQAMAKVQADVQSVVEQFITTQTIHNAAEPHSTTPHLTADETPKGSVC